MAALGYDWELDITSMLDAAYATKYLIKELYRTINSMLITINKKTNNLYLLQFVVFSAVWAS